ncbi:STN domain-containing protein, partial [Escherichia coli]|uniref:STN domain-containing protein n=1 Tax=Escherichia coli TaxID=562 RepID=UPI003BA2381B
MKLTVTLLLFALMQVSATGYAQKITLSVKNAPLRQVLNEIKKQSGFSFLWDENVIKNTQTISIDVRNVSVKEAMDQCLSGFS